VWLQAATGPGVVGNDSLGFGIVFTTFHCCVGTEYYLRFFYFVFT